MLSHNILKPKTSGPKHNLVRAYYSEIGNNLLLTSAEERQLSKVIHTSFHNILSCVYENVFNISELATLNKQCTLWRKKEKSIKASQKKLNIVLSELNKLSGKNPAVKVLRREIHSYSNQLETARDELIISNLRLVVSISKTYQNRGLSLTDLIQEGNLGLLKAVFRFDHTRGYRFATYAVWWVKQSICLAVAEKKTIRTPIYFRDMSKRFYDAYREQQAKLGYRPPLAEIVRITGIPIDKILLIMQNGMEPISYETPLNDDGKTIFHLLENNTEKSPLQHVLSRELSDILKASLAILTDRQRDVICLRFGLDEPKEHTLKEIGDMFQVTKESIRMTEKRALRRLRKYQQVINIQEYNEC